MADTLSDDLASLRIDRGAPPPSPRRLAWLGWLVAVLGIAAAARQAFSLVEARVFRPEITATEVASVAPAGVSVRVTSTGYVTPQRTAKVAAKVMGRVAEVHIREGEAVRRGQLLFVLETADLESAIASARARVSTALARVEAGNAGLAEVRLQAERNAN